MTAETKPSGLALLRQPFPPNQISKLPKETKKQREERENDLAKGVRCAVCSGWHHKNAVHLDYVGHAALTDRLLDADQNWSWEPVAFRDGLPAFDQTGGLWIKLTVCGVTRLGYGHAASKQQMDPGAREKEVIGDALRNAAMRFGAALDLWHKGDLHAHDQEEEAAPKQDLTKGGSVKHTPTDEVVTLDGERETIIRLAASAAVAKFKKGDQIGAYEEISGITDADEKLYLWQILKSESALRSFIKKHAQELREAEAA